MDKKLIMLFFILILALIAFYYSNPRRNLIGNLPSSQFNFKKTSPSATPVPSASPTILASATPDSSPQSSALPSPTTFPDGLIVQDTSIGSGAEVKAGNTVVMHYLGTLQNGQKFDSSYDRNQPFVTQIGVGQVIQGWDEGVPGMKVGGKRKLIIPPSLGYGDQAVGTIPPSSTLVFEVELLQIK